MIKAKNTIMKERIWTNRVAQRDNVFQEALHVECMFAVREEPST